jgi:polyisoprenoid-binding protein YceI
MPAPKGPVGSPGRTAPGLPPAGRYALDPPHTFVGFRARHKVVGIVRGRFDRTEGTIVVSSDPAQCSVEVSIDASSLSTQNEMRDADVKGPDFFDAARYATITYRGKGLRGAGDGRWIVDGTLTIRDVSSEASSEPDVWIEIDCEALEAEPGGH